MPFNFWISSKSFLLNQKDTCTRCRAGYQRQKNKMEEEAYVTPAHAISYSDRLWIPSRWTVSSLTLEIQTYKGYKRIRPPCIRIPSAISTANFFNALSYWEWVATNTYHYQCNWGLQCRLLLLTAMWLYIFFLSIKSVKTSLLMHKGEQKKLNHNKEILTPK
jgi:hypothetical protein